MEQREYMGNIIYLDCFPSGRFCVGFIVPPAEHATIIFESLSSFSSTPAQRWYMRLIAGTCINGEDAASRSRTCYVLFMNSGFSSVPANMPKKANAALLAISHAVHSFINLYICTLTAPGG